MKLTGAAILVSRGMKALQAAPAAYPYRSAFILERSRAISHGFGKKAFQAGYCLVLHFRWGRPLRHSDDHGWNHQAFSNEDGWKWRGQHPWRCRSGAHARLGSAGVGNSRGASVVKQTGSDGPG